MRLAFSPTELRPGDNSARHKVGCGFVPDPFAIGSPDTATGACTDASAYATLDRLLQGSRFQNAYTDNTTPRGALRTLRTSGIWNDIYCSPKRWFWATNGRNACNI